MSLTQRHCEACRTDTPALTDSEIAESKTAIPDWAIVTRNGVKKLQRTYKFKDFKQAQAFLNSVADIAEQEFHHPSLLLEWGKLTVTWWTHKINGLHRNDFIMAARTEQLSQSL